MRAFATLTLPARPTDIAPDGSDVRPLLAVASGSMAHFELAAGTVSRAVTHRSVEEIWFVLSGCGEMWRKQGEHEETVALEPGVCLTIPLGTHFQFRASSQQAVSVIVVTMPPWTEAAKKKSGEDEAMRVVGRWPVVET